MEEENRQLAAGNDSRHIKITSGRSPLLETTLEIGTDKFLVLTEPDRSGCLVTRIFNQGRIVCTRKTGPVAGEAGDHILSRHNFVIKLFRQDFLAQPESKKASGHIDDVRELIKVGKLKPALEAAESAAAIFPGNVMLTSYRGFLLARVRRQFKEGLNECLSAISGLHDKVPFGAEFFYPILYLNLGRVYLDAGDKARAFAAFTNGLATDPGNKEIAWEIKKLGARRQPVFTFLQRSNPLNRLAGKLRAIAER
ncbi:MAG: hypothetical protein M0018_02600 [Nitrospiraceae bacterium]|nr:hypothetical protein [Nitrospiraceae bacterium]